MAVNIPPANDGKRVKDLIKLWQQEGLIQTNTNNPKLSFSHQEKPPLKSSRMNFKEYLSKYCKEVALADANIYADRGKKLLVDISQGQADLKNKTTQAITDDAVCILWSIIKDSFADPNNKGFGKGMVLISLGEEEKTKELYNYLYSASHWRPSSHYGTKVFNKDVRFNCRGINAIDNGSVQWPLDFRNLVFSTIKEDGVTKMFFKPETAGLDPRKALRDKQTRDESRAHMKNWREGEITVSEAPEGTEHYGEKKKHGCNELNYKFENGTMVTLRKPNSTNPTTKRRAKL